MDSVKVALQYLSTKRRKEGSACFRASLRQESQLVLKFRMSWVRFHTVGYFAREIWNNNFRFQNNFENLKIWSGIDHKFCHNTIVLWIVEFFSTTISNICCLFPQETFIIYRKFSHSSNVWKINLTQMTSEVTTFISSASCLHLSLSPITTCGIILLCKRENCTKPYRVTTSERRVHFANCLESWKVYCMPRMMLQ